MAKFHINPISGVASKCSAQKDNCPFGLDIDHFDSLKAAREGYEKRSSNRALLSLSKSPIVIIPEPGGDRIFSTDRKFVEEKGQSGDRSVRVQNLRARRLFNNLWDGITKNVEAISAEGGQTPNSGIVSLAYQAGTNLSDDPAVQKSIIQAVSDLLSNERARHVETNSGFFQKVRGHAFQTWLARVDKGLLTAERKRDYLDYELNNLKNYYEKHYFSKKNEPKSAVPTMRLSKYEKLSRLGRLNKFAAVSI